MTDQEITERLARECIGLRADQADTRRWFDGHVSIKFSPLTDYNDLFRCVDAMEARGWRPSIYRRDDNLHACTLTLHSWIYTCEDRHRAIALAILAALDAEKETKR